jgi:hypothetical protein
MEMFGFVHTKGLSHLVFQSAVDIFDKLMKASSFIHKNGQPYIVFQSAEITETKKKETTVKTITKSISLKLSGYVCLLIAAKVAENYFNINDTIGASVLQLLEDDRDNSLLAREGMSGKEIYIDMEQDILCLVRFSVLDGNSMIDCLSYFLLFTNFDSRKRALVLVIMTHSSICFGMLQFNYSAIVLASMLVTASLLDSQIWVSFNPLFL